MTESALTAPTENLFNDKVSPKQIQNEAPDMKAPRVCERIDHTKPEIFSDLYYKHPSTLQIERNISASLFIALAIGHLTAGIMALFFGVFGSTSLYPYGLGYILNIHWPWPDPFYLITGIVGMYYWKIRRGKNNILKAFIAFSCISFFSAFSQYAVLAGIRPGIRTHHSHISNLFASVVVGLELVLSVMETVVSLTCVSGYFIGAFGDCFTTETGQNTVTNIPLEDGKQMEASSGEIENEIAKVHKK